MTSRDGNKRSLHYTLECKKWCLRALSCGSHKMAETAKRLTVAAVARRINALDYVIDSLAAHSEETHGDAFRTQVQPLVTALYDFWDSHQTVRGVSDLDLGQYLAAVDSMRDVVVKLSSAIVMTPIALPESS